MKKKVIVPIFLLVVSAILFIPFNVEIYKDGGTKEFNALSYKLVMWNKLDYEPSATVYFFPDTTKTIDELWDIEVTKQNLRH